jgi:hypothetical protein
MGDRDSDDPEARPRPTAPGPFDGYRLGASDVPVRVYDLGLGGCLVELCVGTLSGRIVKLQIDLPDEGWVVVQCETLHSAGHNTFAVKFVRMDEPTRQRIERSLNRLLTRPPEPDRAA